MSSSLYPDTQIDIDGMIVEVIRKHIRNIHLRVYAHTGQIRISAPRRMSIDAIRLFARSKTGWIKKQQQKIEIQHRHPPYEFITGEHQYLWGQYLLLNVIEKQAVPSVHLTPDSITLQIRPNSSITTREAIMDKWYQCQIKEALPPLISKWEPLMNVKVKKIHLQKMKTRWGSCNTHTHHIRLNTHLAKKPPICLEYVVVHELVHLLEPSHNQKFYALMDQFMPGWKSHRELLNKFPDRHEHWSM